MIPGTYCFCIFHYTVIDNKYEFYHHKYYTIGTWYYCFCILDRRPAPSINPAHDTREHTMVGLSLFVPHMRRVV